MFEVGKSAVRRRADSAFATRYFVGDGIDIGSGNDPLALYQAQYPCMTSCRSWDYQNGDGDAMLMKGIEDHTFDFVHSSHTLEHLTDPRTGLHHWWRILKPHGHLIFVVPDEDLYEQGVFPSTWNPDHKHTFTIYKAASWSPVSVNVLELLMALEGAEILLVHRQEWGNRPTKIRQDQTLTVLTESCIECVVRKGKNPTLTP